MQIKYYECEKCGEDIYEDDDDCIGCGVEVDQSKFKVEDIQEMPTHIEAALVINGDEHAREADRSNRAATEEKVS